MKNIRFVLPLLVAVFLLLPVSKAQADAFTGDSLTTSLLPFDTVNCTGTNAPVFGFKITTTSPDTLRRVTITSFNELAFAVKKVYLYLDPNADGYDGDETLLKSVTLGANDRFETNDTVQFSATNMYVFDTLGTYVFYFVVDVKNDSVCADSAAFHGTCMEAVLDTNDITFMDGTTGPADSVIHSFDFDPNGPAGMRRVCFDTEAPIYSLHWDWLDEGAGDNCKIDTIDLLDTLVLWANNSPVGDTSDLAGDITLDLSFLGLSSTFKLEKSENYIDTVTIPDEVIANCIDVIAGYTITGSAFDSAGNEGIANLVFDKPIDTCKPTIDSLKFFISGWVTDSMTAAIGDTLTVWAFCLSNPDWEIDSVVANVKNFLGKDTTINLNDRFNNNRIFRGFFVLDRPLPLDIPADSSANRIWVTAWDNACNTKLDSIDLEKPVDLEPPSIDVESYQALMDFDSSGCLNIGDSVFIRVGTDATPDEDSVVALVLQAGIGVTATEHLTETSSNVWDLRWLILEPPSDSAKDVNSTPMDADYSVWGFVYDDAGNKDSTKLTLPVPWRLDTRRPTAIIKDSIEVVRLPGGKVRFIWTGDSPPQAEDPMYFWVYVDSTGGGFDFNTPFGATFDGEYSANQNAWTSEVLTSGKLYKFVIRTEDDCANFEFNQNVFEVIPDAVAPLICIVEPDTGLSFGPCSNCLVVKALTSDMDADSARIMWRIKDVGGGVPGPWHWWGSDMDTLAGDTTYPGHKVFIDTLCNFPGTDTYELIVIGWDLVGNQTSIDFALTCSPRFYFHWYDYVLDADFVSINGAYSPQSACGYDVWRDSLNQVVVTILDTTYNDFVYTVDIWAIKTPGGDSTRVEYKEHQRMPYTFDSLNVSDWPKGTQQLFVKITDERTECSDTDQIALCVPDTLAPQASIVYPRYGQRVHRASNNPLNPVYIKAKVNFNALDPEIVANVHFEYSLNQTDWFVIQKLLGTDTTMVGDTILWVAAWDNSNLDDGDTVYLRAKFYDELHNEYITPLVMVIIDALVPDMVLIIPQMKVINGVKKINGTIDLIGELNNSVNDIAEVKFYRKRSDQPDMFLYYTFIETGTEITNQSIWKLANVSTSGWGDQYFWDIRLIAKDIAGNVMWDYDGDQLFDAYTFNEFAPSDERVFLDNVAPQPAIFSVMSIGLDDTIETVNPSTWLGGSAKAFTQAGKLVQIRTTALRWPPYDMMVDTAEVEKIEYDIDGSTIGYRTSYPYTVTFNPADFGYTAIDGYDSFKLKATCYDWLGNTVTDTVRIYILDVTGNEVVITSPANNSYRSRDITLQGAALDGYTSDIKSVTYQYGVVGSDTTWYDICTASGVGSCTWHTYNNDLNHDGDYTNDDGWYPLRAMSKDSSDNFAYGPMIRVNVTNHNPFAYMIMPDDSTIIGGNLNIKPVLPFWGDSFDVKLRAVARKYSPSSAGIDSVDFKYKQQTSGSFSTVPYGPDSMTLFQDSIYANVWGVEGKSSGWYHLGAQVWDSAGNMAWTDTLDIFIDNEDPQGKLMYVNGDYNSWMKDITEPDTALLVARAWDLPADYNAGLDTVQFIITDFPSWGSGNVYFMGSALPGDTTGQYYITWNHAGVTPNTYWVYLKLVDGVNNKVITQGWPVRILDKTVPVGVVRAFHPKRIYASTENPVDYLQFEYKPVTGALGGSDWIKLSLADTVSGFVDLWSAPWDPMSLAGVDDMDYLVRAVPVRDTFIYEGGDKLHKFVAMDNFIAPEVLITVTPEGKVTPQGTEDIGPMSFMANSLGPVKGTATFDFFNTTKKPYFLAVYSDLIDSSISEEIIILRKETGSDTYNGLFNAGNISSFGGTARFYASTYYGNACWIENAGFSITKVTRDFGTNGWVWSMDGTAKITIPTGAVSSDTAANLLIYPAQAPYNPIIIQKDLLPVGNENGLLQHFYLYSDTASELDDGGPIAGGDISFAPGVYSTIVLSYNEDEVQIAESTLQVARWSGTSSGWSFSDIRDLVIDTENNTATFKTNQMGLYAVVQKTSGGSIFATIEVEPNCSDYTYEYPLFKAKIIDEYSGVNVGSIEIRYGSVGGYLDIAYKDSDHAAGFDFPDGYYNYDPISGILKIEKIDQPIPAGTYVVKVSARNNFGILAADTFIFAVETAPPEIYIPKHYVSKNPEFWFTVSDLESGVDTNSIYIDFAGATDDASDVFERKLYFTMTPSQIDIVNDTVYIDPFFEMKNDEYLHVVIYNGFYRIEHQENEDYVRVYPGDSSGVYDCVGNHATAIHQWFPVDREAPVCSLLTTQYSRPLLFWIRDAKSFKLTDLEKSGVDSIRIWEDGVLAPADSYSFDPFTEILTYYPKSGGTTVQISVWDKVGNGYLMPAFWTIEDGTVPVVTFIDVYNGYLPKDPTIKFTITDDVAGVDWDSVKVDVFKSTTLHKTFYSNDVQNYRTDATTVEIPIPDFSNNNDLRVVVYCYRSNISSYQYTAYKSGVYDLAGNYASPASYIYRVDTQAPSLSRMTADDEKPVKVEVTETGCGVATVVADPAGDSSFFDPVGMIFTYYPSSGDTMLTITATDNVGNAEVEAYKIKWDVAPPVVRWISDGLYQSKDPVVKFTLTDVGTGVDWDSVKVDVFKSTTLHKTFYSNDVQNYRTDDTTVEIPIPDFGNNDDMRVVVYCYRSNISSYQYTAYKSGVYDLAGNHASPSDKMWKIDTAPPSITMKSELYERPIVVQITDAGSGVDWATLNVTVDGDTFEVADTSIDQNTGMVNLHIEDGNFDVMIKVADNVGNATSYTFTTEASVLTIKDAYNWPNPFDPRTQETTIKIGNSKSAKMTVKIYDFAGDYITTIHSQKGAYRWNGRTEDGEMVANGVYLCYIKADDGSNTVTKVVKIAVVKKD